MSIETKHFKKLINIFHICFNFKYNFAHRRHVIKNIFEGNSSTIFRFISIQIHPYKLSFEPISYCRQNQILAFYVEIELKINHPVGLIGVHPIVYSSNLFLQMLITKIILLYDIVDIQHDSLIWTSTIHQQSHDQNYFQLIIVFKMARKFLIEFVKKDIE